MNSGLLGFASVAFVAAAFTLSTRTTDLTPNLRRRRGGGEEPSAAPEQTPTQTAPVPTIIHLVRLGQFKDPRRRVQEMYWESRREIARTLHETALPSETHREFAKRLNEKLNDAATPFSLLTLVFEVAEYSEHEMTEEDVSAAFTDMIQIAEKLNIPWKLGETWKDLRTECENKTNATLRQLGISAMEVRVIPEAVEVQLPWNLPKEKQTQAARALEDALEMQVHLIPVRFCDACKHKLEGTAVEMETCPECGRRLTTTPGPTS